MTTADGCEHVTGGGVSAVPSFTFLRGHQPPALRPQFCGIFPPSSFTRLLPKREPGVTSRGGAENVARHLLSARRVTALLNGGKTRRHGDGGCLYLQVNGPGRGAWVFMPKRAGKQRPIGLGSARDVPLKDARELADACRHAMRKGRDPRSVLAEAAGELTFDAAAREPIESMAPGWRNAKHCAQWSMTLLGEMPAKDTAVLGRGAIRLAKTRSTGAGTSTSYCRSGRASRVATTRRCPLLRCPPSSAAFGPCKAWRHARWNSRS
jgi:hypothetical protein